MKRRQQPRPAAVQTAPPKPSSQSVPPTPTPDLLETAFAACFGAFLGLCLLKFSNPPIMEKFVQPPKWPYETIIAGWPLNWAYGPGAVVLVLGSMVIARSSGQSLRPASGRWLLLLPLAWLVWQVLATLFSIQQNLSLPTLAHFFAAVTCFYLGYFGLSRIRNPWPFWIGMLVCFLVVLAIGLDQHFGGLEAARKSFYQEQQLYPDRQFPPEFVKKLTSTRVYSTLFYPNTLAGAILLLLPPSLIAGLRATDRLRLGTASLGQTLATLIGTTALFIILWVFFNSKAGCLFIALIGLGLVFAIPRWVIPLLIALGAGACLYWSGSKGGWLLFLVLGLTALMQLHLPKTLKTTVLILVLLAGLSGFFVKYAGFFKKGATSVVARFDYWRAALHTAGSNPLLGTGPGTFAIPYEKIKNPNSEMARLVHNDYLEQASDSGIPGALLYAAFVAGVLVGSYKTTKLRSDPMLQAMSLGILGWALQSFVEFGLYLPALAWTAFTFAGWSVAHQNSCNSLR